MHTVLLVWLALFAWAAPAAACDACAPLVAAAEPSAGMRVAAAGARWSGCECAFAFAYSRGPTLGRVAIEASPGLGALAVYDGDGSGEDRLVVAFPAEAAVAGVTVYSRTGTVVVRLVAAPDVESAPDLALALAVTAINQAPVVEVAGPGPGTVRWGIPAPLPVVVRDDDNFNRGLQVGLELSGDGIAALWVPPVDNTTFLVGSPGTLARRVVIEGPEETVREALSRARIEAVALGFEMRDELTTTASDLGNSGEGGVALVTAATAALATVPVAGTILVTRDSGRVTSGSTVLRGTSVRFEVEGAYQIEFVAMHLASSEDTDDLPGPGRVICFDSVRVSDGPLLLSDGDLCGTEIPGPFTSTTGTLTIDFATTSFDLPVTLESRGFDAVVRHAPVGFRVWAPGDGASVLQAAAGGSAVPVPPLAVSSLPDPFEISVTVGAQNGTVALEFAESFVDLGAVQEGTAVTLTNQGAGQPAMLRMGAALQSLVYTPPRAASTDTILVQAWSGGAEAAALEIPVVVAAAVLDGPDSAVRVGLFETAVLGVRVLAGARDTDATVVCEIGQVSTDPRAAGGIDVGLGANITAALSELPRLVYRAGSVAGNDTVVIRAGAVQAVVAVVVEPECRGSHDVYAREGMIAVEPGTRAETCQWVLHGATEVEIEGANASWDSGTRVLEFAPQGASTGFVARFGSRPTDPPLVLVPAGPSRWRAGL